MTTLKSDLPQGTLDLLILAVVAGRRSTAMRFALLLSAAGLYALLAYQVALRTREIGIRSALGADRRAIVTMILGKGVGLAAVGAAMGVVGAASAARVLQSLLYETPAINAPSYAGGAAFVLLVAVIAVWVPARRAAGVSPMSALRED